MSKRSNIKTIPENCDISQGRACGIFRNIKSDKYSAEEKILAIARVLKMETHNSITKKEMLEVIDWLIYEDFEELEDNQYRMDGLMFM